MTKYKAPPTAIYQPTDQEPTYVHGKKSSRQRATLITLVGGGVGGAQMMPSGAIHSITTHFDFYILGQLEHLYNSG
jgi:hypothetical protein